MGMQSSIAFHHIMKLELGEIRVITLSHNKTFATRTLRLTDAEGNEEVVELYGDRPENISIDITGWPELTDSDLQRARPSNL